MRAREATLRNIAGRRAARGQDRRKHAAATWWRAHPCPDTPEPVMQGETYLTFAPQWREWKIRYRSGFGGGDQRITYCPFCGQRLPESLTDQWSEQLQALGIDEPFSTASPLEYQTSAWWEDTHSGPNPAKLQPSGRAD